MPAWRSTHFHLLVKLVSLPFPCFDDVLRQACPSRNLVICNMALAEVQKQFMEVRIFDHIDRLRDIVGNQEYTENHWRQTWSSLTINFSSRMISLSLVNGSTFKPETCCVVFFCGMLRRQHSDFQISRCFRSVDVGEVCSPLLNTFHTLAPRLFLNIRSVRC
jgi:hypothetical protein